MAFTWDSLIFKQYKNDYENLTNEAKAKYKTNLTALATVLNDFLEALTAAGFGPLSVSSAWRSYAAQEKLYIQYAIKTTSEDGITMNQRLVDIYNLAHKTSPAIAGVTKFKKHRKSTDAKPRWDCNPECVPPGGSSHEEGLAADCKAISIKSYDEFILFAFKWFSQHGYYNRLLDEAGSTVPNGWLHLHISSLQTLQKRYFFISWPGLKRSYDNYESYKNARIEAIESGTYKNVSEDQKNLIRARANSIRIVGDATSATAITTNTTTINSTTNSAENASTATTPKEEAVVFTDEEYAERNAIQEANDELLINSAVESFNDEFAILQAANINEFTEENILLVESDVDDIEEYGTIPTNKADDNVVVINTDGTAATTIETTNIFTLSTPENNTSNIKEEDNKKDENPVPRIYLIYAPATKVIGLSLNLSDAGAVSNEAISESNTNSADESATSATTGANYVKTIGNVAPLIVIKDTVIQTEEILKFSIDNTEFLPTASLTILTSNNKLITSDYIKSGDVMSVFINSNNLNIKSLRSDFIITDVGQSKIMNNSLTPTSKLSIYGKLYIKNYYNNTNFKPLCGTSDYVLEKIADTLGLGFNLCDIKQQMNDRLVWSMPVVGTSGESPYEKFIKYVTAHSYQSHNAFFDSWIDPRYNLNFININKMLGEDGEDPNIDKAILNNSFSEMQGADGIRLAVSSLNQNQFAPKILSNIYQDAFNNIGNFYVTAFHEEQDNSVDNSGNYINNSFIINNSAMDQDKKEVSVQTTICSNPWKLANGFTLLGRSNQLFTQQQVEDENYTLQYMTATIGLMQNFIATSEIKTFEETGETDYLSGNTHKFFNIAELHNALNNKWLKKKLIILTINGKNLLIMRGEKIPALIINYSGDAALPTSPYEVFNKVYEQYSGWFIITGLTYKYDANKMDDSSRWSTIVTLTRREWPIPNWTNTAKIQDEEKDIVILNIIDEKNSIQSAVLPGSNDKSADEISDESTSDDLQESLDGVEQDALDIFTLIKAACSTNNLKLIVSGAKRWGLAILTNSAGQEVEVKIDGPSEINLNNKYKFQNAKGETLWFSSATSSHVYGRAIDFINEEGTKFDDIAKTIMLDNHILVEMLTKGYYIIKELSGASVHYHLGKIVSNDDFDNAAKWWENSVSIVLEANNNSTIINYNDATYDVKNWKTYVASAETKETEASTNDTTPNNTDETTTASSNNFDEVLFNAAFKEAHYDLYNQCLANYVSDVNTYNWSEYQFNGIGYTVIAYGAGDEYEGGWSIVWNDDVTLLDAANLTKENKLYEVVELKVKEIRDNAFTAYNNEYQAALQKAKSGQ